MSRAVTPGLPRRLHGYLVTDDLARHYHMSEVAWLGWTGELPTGRTATIAEACLVQLSAAPVWEGPTHAGVLARVSGAGPAGVAGACAVALAEAARWEMEWRSDLWVWLEKGGEGPPPAPFCLPSGDPRAEEAAVLRQVLADRGDDANPGEEQLQAQDMALCALWRQGLRSAALLEAAWIWARLPCALAEAMTWAPGRVGDYPLKHPAFCYEEPDR